MFLPDNTVFVPVKDPNLSGERTKNARLPMDQRLHTFSPVDATYTEAEALVEAQRCLKCPTHWCQNNCPANLPIPDFIARVRQRDYAGAYALISSASTLPEMCSRLCPQEKQCQLDCTRGIITQAVGIGKLERFVVEQHYQSCTPEAPSAPSGKAVAVVGSGPSGLSAAAYLCGQGHQVTVYERSDRAGGLLQYGIPNMKLKKGVLDRKLSAMTAAGVTFQTRTDVGTDVAPADLLQAYDAVIVCVGAGKPRTLALAGAAGVRGICYAVDFLSANTKSLRNTGSMERTAAGRDVVIIGGGDTGNDCVGTCLRQGCASVTQIEMLPQTPVRNTIYSPIPTRVREQKFDSSQEEYLTVFCRDPHIYETTVKAVQADAGGAISSVTTIRLRQTQDDQGRIQMEEIPGTEQTIPCGLLLIAAGFLGPERVPDFGIKADARSNLATQDGFATNVGKVFACGDCHTGQSLVVRAMAQGRDCAKQVDRYLKTS